MKATKRFFIIAISNFSKLGSLTVCSCHVTYTFQSEFTLCSCLNVKELLTQIRREIASLDKWLSFVYELSGCGFESSCSHLHFRYRAWFE